MVVYKIYHAKFCTRLGTTRADVGHTRPIDLRKLWAEQKPPPAMRCRDPQELVYKTVEDGIEGKAAALALEALYAARAIVAEPATARGGPWSNWTLSEAQWDEVRAAAGCRTPRSLHVLIKANRRGSLYRHLRDLALIAPSDAPADANEGLWCESGSALARAAHAEASIGKLR